MSANIIPAIQIQGISAETLLGQIKEVVKELLPGKTTTPSTNPNRKIKAVVK